MSTLVTGTIKSNTSNPPVFQNTSGTEIGTLCRAWVNFNGTSTVAIRASYNVSSITDNGTGDYTVNFATALADTNYSVGGSSSGDSGSLSGITVLDGGAYSTSAMRFVVRYAAAGSGLVDRAKVAVQIFR